MRDLTVNEKRRELLAKFQGARSLCTCGHTGDLGVGDLALLSDHEGVIGHGSCTVEGCSCAKFMWAGYVPALEAALERASEGASTAALGAKVRGAKATAERRLLICASRIASSSKLPDGTSVNASSSCGESGEARPLVKRATTKSSRPREPEPRS